MIDRVEELAPDGFTRLEDVIDPAELEAIVTGYAKASGVTRAPQLDGPWPGRLAEPRRSPRAGPRSWDNADAHYAVPDVHV